MSKLKLLDADKRELLLFKWDDDNPDEEDRIGYFVKLKANSTSGKCIEKSTDPANILGVTIESPICSHSIEGEDCTSHIPSKYVYVSPSGEVTVKDDGTCVVGNRCTVSSTGIATPATSGGFKVLNRVNDNHISILLRSYVSGSTLIMTI